MLETVTPSSSDDAGVDRKALAGLMLEIAQNLRPELRALETGMLATDLRLDQLRTLVLGREIELLAQMREVLEDPERLAAAVGRVLPSAIAQASTDTGMGPVLAPAMEKATESSIRSNPRTLVNILYPLIVPAIRKSIGETIDETFQSLNETLKYSLSLRGLKWRWEAWRTGTSFAEVVLKHTLVYQVEHVFLIHRHTGLLICHVAAENAASQDPQLVSSMLTAIQDFVRDSFSGAEQQGVDTLRLGELRLWSEPGPFATLVAVIRGDPPESLHDTLREVLSKIHEDRHHALESFDGDSTGFGDIQARLAEVVVLQQKAPPRVSFRRVVVLAWLGLLLLFVGAWGFRWWLEARHWDAYVARLAAEPGIVVAESGRRNGKFLVSGLRDPLAVDPQLLLSQAGIDQSSVDARWAPYQAFDPPFVLRRLQASLEPPAGVTLTVEGGRIVARGSASSSWLEHARRVGDLLPAGAPALDLSGVRNIGEAGERRWNDYIARLRAEPGIVITEARGRDGNFLVAGLRDPLAVDPQLVLSQMGLDATNVVARWLPYEALDPPFVLKRLQASLDPPPSVTLAVEGGRIVAQGSASSSWLARARSAGDLLPAGAPAFDLSGVRNINEADERLWDGYIARLRAEPGIVVTETRARDGNFLVAGLRDPLAADPQMLLRDTGLDSARVVTTWTPYQAFNPQFVLQRLQALLDPPPTVTLELDGDRIVARGSASSPWLDRARNTNRALPAGTPHLDLSEVRNISEGVIGKLRDAIQARTIRFDNNVSLPAAGQDGILDAAAADLKELASLSGSLSVSTKVMLTGHSDAVGGGTSNLSLSMARAEAVRALLKKRGVDPDMLMVRGAGPLELADPGAGDAARAANRRVSFTVAIGE